MIYFILGTFLGSFLFFGARIADVKLTLFVDRYKKTGSMARREPIIIDGEDKAQKIIDEIFEPKREV
jgi:hypothetical protein